MARRRRTAAVKFNGKLVTDVVVASMITQKAPDLLMTWLPFGEQLRPVVGGAAGYLTGMLAKRPDMANASIALAVTDFVSPFIDSLLGGIGVGTVKPEMIPGAAPTGVPAIEPSNVALDDYINLNDYVMSPGFPEAYDRYKDTY